MGVHCSCVEPLWYRARGCGSECSLPVLSAQDCETVRRLLERFVFEEGRWKGGLKMTHPRRIISKCVRRIRMRRCKDTVPRLEGTQLTHSTVLWVRYGSHLSSHIMCSPQGRPRDMLSDELWNWQRQHTLPH